MLRTPIETTVEDAAHKAGGILRSRYGLWALATISFFESALPVPILTDPFLIAYTLADKKSVKKGVIVTTLASVLGGVFAFVLAFSFYEFIAEQYLIGAVGEQFYVIVEEFQKGTFVLALLGAITPLPYTLVAFAAGFVEGSIVAFIVASVIGRGLRYSLVAWLTYHFGEKALDMARRQILLMTVVLVLVIVAYILVH